MSINNDLKHPLHVLTETQFKHISDNNITVKDIIPLNISVHEKKVRQTFCKISRNDIGVNILPHFENLKHDNIICLSSVKKNFLSITTEVNSRLRNDNMVSLLGGESSKSSNMVLLFLATYNKDVKQDTSINQHIDIYRRNRFNINHAGKTGNHFGTVGESYGLGLVPKYKQNNLGLTFGEYSDKMKTMHRNQIYTLMRCIMSKQLEEAIVIPCLIIPELIDKMFAFEISTKKYLSSLLPENYIKKLRIGKCQMETFMSTQININVTVSIPHTEPDRSSTLIYVPEQTNKNHSYGFEIKLNFFSSMVIRLVTGTTIIYSAYMITHRQIKIDHNRLSGGENSERFLHKHNSEQYTQREEFINISTYYSTGLYSHIQSSVKRYFVQKEAQNGDL